MNFFPDTPAVVDSNRILYTPSAFARSSLLHLQEIGSLRALRPHTSSRSDLPSYLFFEVVSGSGTLLYNHKSYDLKPGSCVFIDCLRPYSHTTDRHLWTIRWIHFSGPSMASVYEKYCDRGGLPAFSPKDLKPVSEIHASLMAAASSDNYLRDMEINRLLSALLVEIMRESWHPETKRHAGKKSGVLEVREWIDAHYAENITLEGLASRFFINKYYLSKSFRARFGVTVSAYVRTVRITKAKQLLRFTGKSLEEIGELVGITPARYFSEVFSAVEGISPAVYRKQW